MIAGRVELVNAAQQILGPAAYHVLAEQVQALVRQAEPRALARRGGFLLRDSTVAQRSSGEEMAHIAMPPTTNTTAPTTATAKTARINRPIETPQDCPTSDLNAMRQGAPQGSEEKVVSTLGISVDERGSTGDISTPPHGDFPVEQAIKTKGAVPHAPGTGEMASLARASRMAEAMAAQSAAARETWAHLRVKVRHPIHGTCVVVAGPTASDLGPVLEVEAPSFSRHLVLVRDLGAV